MIPADRLVLLDTNVLLYIARGRDAGGFIVERYGLRSRLEKPLVSVVSLGELWRIAYRRRWGDTQRDRLAQMGTQVVVIDLEPEIVRTYGEFGAYLDNRGKPIPQNDLWIAATAAVKRAVLLTTDRHFDVLSPGIDHVYIDPTALPR